MSEETNATFLYQIPML